MKNNQNQPIRFYLFFKPWSLHLVKKYLPKRPINIKRYRQVNHFHFHISVNKWLFVNKWFQIARFSSQESTINIFYQGSQEKIKHVNHFWILAIVTTMMKLKIFNPDTIQTEFKTFHYSKSKLVLSVFLMSN